MSALDYSPLTVDIFYGQPLSLDHAVSKYKVWVQKMTGCTTGIHVATNNKAVH